MSNNVEIFAHRGLSGFYPENTMAAFKAAVEVGAHGIELDVQMSKEGELVVIHDEKLERTTNGVGYVKDLTLNQLKQYDAGSWFHADFENEKIPTLNEVLEWVKLLPKKLIVNIELKNDRIEYENLEKKVLRLIYELNLQQQCILSSFNRDSLKKIYELDHNIETALLFQGVPTDVLNLAKNLHVQALHSEAVFAQSILGRKANLAGYPIRVFTINTLVDFNSLKNTNTSVVMTDFPQLFL
ncbi:MULTISPECIES: glycerophosphodiester phosphodiesterase [Bacillaceae]|uniref:glycerophosphodiester phosphodiesterase n=1 Tax=Bacillaceae TaxID=186817 RepID=UPI000BFC7141|nr:MULTISPECIES: glycerophosphodiester phosphodiesterase [Bacillaceae]PGT82250.1 glycerophosphodiester phosphodiesterase [Bacillus sp. AFS040349]UGB31406.1 glycerophosphodiester phosphodiesterase [Metabacillus sp. B2-18]